MAEQVLSNETDPIHVISPPDTTNTSTASSSCTSPAKPALAPLVSALRSTQTGVDSDTKATEPKHTVSFAPGLINPHGKSDIAEIANPKQEASSTPPSSHTLDDSSDSQKLVLVDAASASLSFTDFKFGSSFSGSETSDDEKDFGKLNDKYRSWSRQHVRNEERKEEAQVILKQSMRKLRQTKETIADMQSSMEADPDLDNTYREWKRKQNKKGVVYIASVPFGCTSLQLKKIFSEFGVVGQVHLEAAKGDDKTEKKKRPAWDRWKEFCEAWVEFKDKKIARQVAELLHDTKIPKKYVKNRLARNHVWNMKYLKGFGWHHLTEYKNTVRTLQRKKYEMKIADAKRQTDYFESQVRKAMEMTADVKKGSRKRRRMRKKEREQHDEVDEAFASEDEIKEPDTKKQKVVVQKTTKRRLRGHKDTDLLMDKLMK